MILRPVYPASVESFDTDDAASRDAVRELYRAVSPSVVRINLIASVNGSVGGSDGTSNTLSSPVDRMILGVIRGLSDVVLVGAQSVRTESYVLPRTAPLAIVTSSGDLDGHGIDPEVEPGRVFVLCPATSVDIVRRTLGPVSAEIIALPDSDGRLDVGDVVTALRVRALESIVCEGGPTLAAQLFDAGLVDELCLSTSPLLSGSGSSVLGTGLAQQRRLDLVHLLVDDASGVYARWAVATDPPLGAPLATE